MNSPLHILVLCGGQSTEHDISLLSAKNIIKKLDSKKYTVSVAKIEQNGRWFYYKTPAAFFANAAPQLMHITPGDKSPFDMHIDCVFPITHGTNGEDGIVQGLLELLQIPYVSADCLGSAIAMDKDIAKRLMRDAGILVIDWIKVKKSEKINYHDVTKQLGSVLFIKPNSLGSSVGVHKVVNEASFYAALQDAFQFDEIVLIEKAIVGREIECSVLGNENPTASLLGEIINHTEFYSYDAKYIDDDSATVKIPANISPEIMLAAQTMAINAFKALRIIGMARVDFFLAQDGTLFINELNTLPGFTNISMYPKNWEASGLPYADLLDELIQLALQRFEFKKSLNRVYSDSDSDCDSN